MYSAYYNQKIQRIWRNLWACTSEKLSSMLIGIHGVLEKHALTEMTLFFREGLVYFSNTMLNCILHHLQQHGIIVEEPLRLQAVVLNCLQSRGFRLKTI